MGETISVILPVTGSEGTLKACLENLLAQSYAPVEVILAGGSAPEGMSADPRLRVVRGGFGSVFEAAMAGLAEAGGSLIAFADENNRLDGGMFEKMAAALEEKDADIAIARDKIVQEVRFVDPEQAEPEDETEEEIVVPRWDKVFGPRKASYELLTGQSVTGVLWDKLFRRSLFEGISAPPDGVAFPEEALLLELFGRDRAVVHLREPLFEREPGADGGGDRFGTQLRQTLRQQERIQAAEKRWPAFAGRILPAYREELEQLVLTALGTDWADARPYETMLKDTLWPFFAAHEAEASAGASWQKRTKYRILLEKPKTFWNLWPMIRRIKSFLIHD